MSESPRQRRSIFERTLILLAILISVGAVIVLLPFFTCPACLGVGTVTWDEVRLELPGGIGPGGLSGKGTLAVCLHCEGLSRVSVRLLPWNEYQYRSFHEAGPGKGSFSLTEEQCRLILKSREATP